MPVQCIIYFTSSWCLNMIIIKPTAVIIDECHFYQLHRELWDNSRIIPEVHKWTGIRSCVHWDKDYNHHTKVPTNVLVYAHVCTLGHRPQSPHKCTYKCIGIRSCLYSGTQATITTQMYLQMYWYMLMSVHWDTGHNHHTNVPTNVLVYAHVSTFHYRTRSLCWRIGIKFFSMCIKNKTISEWQLTSKNYVHNET